MTVSELGERRLLARIKAKLPKPPATVVVGVGDDAAVVEGVKNARLVLTTDGLVEGVHFERTYSEPADIGHKALAVNLSDLAAMGAEPAWALLSLALPDATPVELVDGLLDGLVALADSVGVAVVGGNLTRSPASLVVDVTAVGTVHPRRVLTRNGGRPGDEIYVSGAIGGGAAGLEMLKASLKAGPSIAGEGPALAAIVGEGPAFRPALAEVDEACIARYRRPTPRVRLGRAVGQSRAARAAMDLSDGLADALHQIADASACGVEIDASALPIDEGARRWWNTRGVDPILSALSGGDDYELVIAVPPGSRGQLRRVRSHVADPPLTRIGVLTRTQAERVLKRNERHEPLPSGFEHW